MEPLAQDAIRLDLPGSGDIDIEIVYHKRTRQVSHTSIGARGTPAVILLPHWGGTARTYGILQAHLAKSHPEVTTVAISYPGTGHSSRDVGPPEGQGFSQKYPIHSLALTLKALLPKLVTEGPHIEYKVGVVLVGHSMGGKVALALLASGLDIPIRGLLLLAPAPPGRLVLPPPERSARSKAYDTPEIAREATQSVLFNSFVPDDIMIELVEDAVRMDVDAKRGWIEHGIDEDIVPKLEVVSDVMRRTKIRILVGQEDKVEPLPRVQIETMDVLQKRGRFDAVSTRVVADCGHMITIERAGMVAEEVIKLVD